MPTHRRAGFASLRAADFSPLVGVLPECGVERGPAIA